MELNKKTIRNIFLGVIACILMYWLLHDTDRVSRLYQLIKGIVSPFVIGAVLAFIMNVPMRAFERLLKGIQKPLLRRLTAVSLTFVANGRISVADSADGGYDPIPDSEAASFWNQDGSVFEQSAEGQPANAGMAKGKSESWSDRLGLIGAEGRRSAGQ